MSGGRASILLSALALPSASLARSAELQPSVGEPAIALTSPRPDGTGAARAAAGLEEPSAASAGSNQANNPLEPSIMFSLQNFYIPKIHGLDDRTADVTLLRALVPSLAFGQPQLIRATLPIITVPTAKDRHDRGVGDLLLMDLAMFPVKGGSVGVGPVAVVPLGNRIHGSQKWQAGVTAGAAFPRSWGLFGALGIYQHSIAGKEDRDDVRLLTVQPILFYNLPANFYLLSSGILNFDLEHGQYYLPVGLGAGRVWPITRKFRLNTYVQPEYTVAHQGAGAPVWQVYAGFNLQYVIK